MITMPKRTKKTEKVQEEIAALNASPDPQNSPIDTDPVDSVPEPEPTPDSQPDTDSQPEPEPENESGASQVENNSPANKFKPSLPSFGSFSQNLQKVKTVKPLHIAAGVIVLAIVLSGTFYLRSQQELQTLRKNPQEIVKKETRDIVAKIGKLITLPQGEDPTVATVTDPEKLKSQPFFAQARKDDKVLIYANAKKAILYRPSINKVVDIAPISGSATPQGQVAGAQAEQKLKFAVFNGTNTTGLARKYQKEIETKVQNSQVATVGDARGKDVAKTFVVSLSGADSAQIASTLGIEQGNLPDGEQKPDADFLVIVGLDKSNL